LGAPQTIAAEERGAAPGLPPMVRRRARGAHRSLPVTLNFMVAPDFPPQHFPGWHMLNTVLQRRSGIGLHLLLPSGAGEQAQMVAEDRVDLVYANPFDATGLVRDKGFLPVVRR